MISKNIFSGGVIWITGLSGSGKTTLAKKITESLRESTSYSVVFLDGDILREVFGKEGLNFNSYNRMQRLELAKKYSFLSNILSQQGHIVVIATISLFKEIHQWNRNNIKNYIEVYLNLPISVLKQRDPKGLYRKFSEGKLKNIYGLDMDFDEPENPDFIFSSTEIESIQSNSELLISELKKILESRN